jgi:phospholipid-binding lipoprotein MlaA
VSAPLLRFLLLPPLLVWAVASLAAPALADPPQGATLAASLPEGQTPAPQPVPDGEEFDPLFDDLDEVPDDALGAEVYDPLEGSNRAVYGFNRRVDQWLLNPLTRGYRFVVPEPARLAVRRVCANLNMPIYLVNHLLQLRFLDAVETLGAFTMNVTFGVGGLFDTGSGVGLQLKPTDFGQTLARVGVGSGPYLVFPLVGPTTARDGFGFIVDRAFHPLTYFLAIPVQLVGYSGVGMARREEILDGLEALEDSSIDPYAVLRSAYVQARAQALERDLDPDAEPAAATAFVATPGL